MEEKRKRGRPPGKAKTGGRKPGTPNKVTSNLRQAVNDLIDANWGTIEKDLKKVDPKDRLTFLEKMMSYALPKLQSTTIDASVNTAARIDQLSFDQINRIMDHVIAENDEKIRRAADRSDEV